MVLSTLHTNDAVTTPIRLLDMGAPRYMVALSLQMVLAQRLVRLICESCAESYKLLPGEHEWMSLEIGAEKVDSHKYVKGKGCSHCNGTGYLGRTGVYEMLEMTKAVVEAANQDDPAKFIEVATREMGGNTLRAHAVQLVIDGKTTVDEAMRISNQFEDA
jgi:MSHA biogenesis protein MshE